MIPAVILALIAVPTVRTIFRTATKPGPEALQVEVIGHQWWWEFRYPDLGIVTRERAARADRPHGESGDDHGRRNSQLLAAAVRR